MALTGFWVSGVCYASQMEAVAALNSQFPIVTGAFLHHGSAVASGASDALLTIRTINLVAVPDSWQVHAMIFNFSACDPLISPVTLSKIFSMPAVSDVATAWTIAFTLPLILWLTAWGFGVVINMFKHDH